MDNEEKLNKLKYIREQIDHYHSEIYGLKFQDNSYNCKYLLDAEQGLLEARNDIDKYIEEAQNANNG